jgi:hemoglobin
MIGYLFRNVDLALLKDREVSFAAAHLGSTAPYSGRPIRAVHAPHQIRGGQFDRRLVILAETLRAFQVPSDIEERWLEHNRALRSSITSDDSGACSP